MVDAQNGNDASDLDAGEPKPDPEPQEPVSDAAAVANPKPEATTQPDPGATSTQGASDASTNAGSDGGSGADDGKRSNTWIWVLAIVSLLSLELYMYGHNGWIRVCVGKEGFTDFSLLDKPKEKGAVYTFPFCIEQLNLGMYSDGDEVARNALDQACTRGAVLMRGDKQHCIRKEDGWQRRVDKQQVAPWDPRLYRRLLFLD